MNQQTFNMWWAKQPARPRLRQSIGLIDLPDELEPAVSINLKHILALVDEHPVLDSGEPGLGAGITIVAELTSHSRSGEKGDEE